MRNETRGDSWQDALVCKAPVMEWESNLVAFRAIFPECKSSRESHKEMQGDSWRRALVFEAMVLE